ncbi:MAG: hypothetical protein H6700_02610 [Myxococcales bacterium]|nr:hypothetical protein [Myxococcales bacterium]MCB9519638.1 hypothetical protein [Myxococcales bacterium]MCB9530631.1 hypothetical protein [Myxococcales bacterium]
MNSVAVAWDELGRQESFGGRTVVWDDDDLPEKVTTGGVSEHDIVDAFGRVVVRAGVVRTYLGSTLLREEAGPWRRDWFPTDDLDRPVGYSVYCAAPDPVDCGTLPSALGASTTLPSGGLEATYLLAQTFRNDTLGLVDGDGKLVEVYRYGAYGDLEVLDGTTSAAFAPATAPPCSSAAGTCGSQFGNPILWSGAHWRPTVGLYDMRARQYDPRLHTFLSRDPLGYVDSFDEWLYVGGDPFNMWDPFGLNARNGQGVPWEPFPVPNSVREIANSSFGNPDSPMNRGLGRASSSFAVGMGTLALHPVDSSRGLVLAGGACVGSPWQCGTRLSSAVVRVASTGEGRWEIAGGLGLIAAGGAPGAIERLGAGAVVVEGAGGVVVEVGEAAGAGAVVVEGGQAAGTAAGPLAGTGGGATSLFRAVTQSELDNIAAAGGRFSNPPGIEVKYFSTSAQGAASYARQAAQAFSDGPFTIVETSIADSLIAPTMRATVDRGIQTIVVGTEDLGALAPARVWSYTPLP